MQQCSLGKFAPGSIESLRSRCFPFLYKGTHENVEQATTTFHYYN